MLTPEQKFNQFLKFKNQRLTGARDRILKMLFKNHTHIHLENMLAWSKENSISRATLFRTLNMLVEAGLISKFFDEHNRVHYEHIYAHEHHRHLICVKCGNILEVEDPVPEEVVQELCEKNSFTQHYNVFEVFGFCGKCI